jgi:hypothetical protein
MNKKRILIIAVTLLLTIANFTRLKGSENIRPIQFILVFVIGALSALLITEFVILLRIKKQ